MKITEIEQKIKKYEDDILECKSRISSKRARQTKLRNLLSIELGKIINIKKGDIFKFKSEYLRIEINKYIINRTLSNNLPIEIKITDITSKLVYFHVIHGILRPMDGDSGDRYVENYIVCVSKKTLHTLLYEKSSYEDVINRHKTIEDILD